MARIVQEHGINDMLKGWIIKNKYNQKVYQKWLSMLKRVYSEKYHETHPTYINSSIRLEMHWLSYFVEHFKEIDGYDEEKFLNSELELDKDIKSNGQNKEYSIENCMLVSRKENSNQANKTRDYNSMKGENHFNYGGISEEHRKHIVENHADVKGVKNPRATKVAQYDNEWNLIRIWDYIQQASDELNINRNSISACCRGKQKSAGNFKWKYIKEDD